MAGKLGDVKYSILNLDQFRRINGRDWVMMEGQDIEESDLNRRFEIGTLPDARGVFIRGMNLGRDADAGDADGDRAVGVPQTDEFGEHNHEGHQGSIKVAQQGASDATARQDYTQSGFPVADFIDRGGNETRPRNIALYTYIKIDR